MKTQNLLQFFSWTSGILVSLTIGYALLVGPINLPEPFNNNIISNAVGIAIIATTILSVILSFFRK